MTAAFAVSFARGYDIRQALTYAVAVSAANALTMETGQFKPEDMERLLPFVTVDKVG